MIDNIITNTLLPALSREFMKRSRQAAQGVRVAIKDDGFAYT